MADPQLKHLNDPLPWRIIKNWIEKYRQCWWRKSKADNRKHVAKVNDFPPAL